MTPGAQPYPAPVSGTPTWPMHVGGTPGAATPMQGGAVVGGDRA